jgi:hypothetical protein
MLTVHYRWHPHYSERVRVLQRGGETSRVELADGQRCVVAPWMLDAAACARHDEGGPLVDVDALADLATLIGSLLDGQAGNEETNNEEKTEAERSAPIGPAEHRPRDVAVFRRAVVGGGGGGSAHPGRDTRGAREGRGN